MREKLAQTKTTLKNAATYVRDNKVGIATTAAIAATAVAVNVGTSLAVDKALDKILKD